MGAFNPHAAAAAGPGAMARAASADAVPPRRAAPGGVSSRAQAAMAAMDDFEHGGPPPRSMGARPAADGPYAAAASMSGGGGGYGAAAAAAGTNGHSPSSSRSGNGRGRRASGDSIVLGFPSESAKYGSKGQQFVEIFGYRDNEAWEDYGHSRAYHRKSRVATETSVAETLTSRTPFDIYRGTRQHAELERQLDGRQRWQP